jgi:hypothetical protein
MDGPKAAARMAGLLVAFGLVVAAQAMMAVAVLGGRPAIFDSRPVVNGRHPLHLVHGSLGARTFHDRFTTSCFDPAYQAGYPKTPVFDGGCRPAEFVLFIAALVNGDPEAPLESETASYKLGLVAISLLVPLAFAASLRGMGAGGSATILAAAAGTVLWWTPPVRALFDAGELDLLLAGLCGVAFGGALAWYHRHPGPRAWLVMTGLAVVGWYSHPIVWAAFAPLVAIFYLSLAPRHGLAWHLGLFGAGIGGLIPNLWWLSDWARFWWLRQPASEALASLPTAEEVAAAGGWSDLLDFTIVGWPTVLAGVIGSLAMMRLKARTPGWLMLSAIAGSLFAARLGQLWPVLSAVGAERAALLAVALSLIPIAYTIGAWWDRAKIGLSATIAAAAIPMLLVQSSLSIPGMAQNRTPLLLGLSPERSEFVNALRTMTTPGARILLEEDLDQERPGWNWTALLARLTDRAYLGGLDSGACVEPMACSLKTRGLMNRRYEDLTDADLWAFANRYNVGWVACRSEAAATRWQQLPGTKMLGTFRDGNPIVLIALDRKHSFFLTGTGNWERADRTRIVLSNVTPDANGTAAISLHYQPGMRVVPPSVLIEPEKDPFDPTPLVRLRFTGPVSRVTIVWQNP